ncbi:MAG TPA: hypothetical protein VJ351_27605 [Streptosporangiaceae bacterium]|nr:hypothetical protein [Streptosporangiaceae bacterium]
MVARDADKEEGTHDTGADRRAARPGFALGYETARAGFIVLSRENAEA